MQLKKTLLFLLLAISAAAYAQAQEYLLPLNENVEVKARSEAKDKIVRKPTALTLPFFEDFTDYDPYPNAGRWEEQYVYINNTMGDHPLSRGVATFDALDEKGALYSSITGQYTQIYADTLTSLPFDLSSYDPSDSLYLSFFYQPKGHGFSPKPGDSLMLFLLRPNGVWDRVWAAPGDTLQPFKQAMVPITDPDYFYSEFQIRWVNKATIGISNSNWNLDYIRMDINRNQFDTAVRDVAFTADPPAILNDFTAMPFRHFKTNAASFLATNLTAAIRNNGNVAQNVPSGYTATVVGPGTPLGNGNTNTALASGTEANSIFTMYNAGAYNPPDPNGKVVFENRFHCTGNYVGESKINDTIVSHQVFDNYFAYDDGTGEQAYFLNLLPQAPGATAVEYALYAPDTLRGIAIRFARTFPDQSNKEFSVGVYRDIAVNGGTDDQIYQENYLYPNYVDTINKFSVYTFSQPIILQAGVFYISIIQPAGGISDSLQIALDANRVGGNHRYFKVATTWQPSLLDGALMLRPLVGAVLPLGIDDTKQPQLQWSISPNPARDRVRIDIPELKGKKASYSIIDAQGRVMLKGTTHNETDIDIRTLSPGIYFVKISTEAGYTMPLKLLKL